MYYLKMTRVPQIASRLTLRHEMEDLVDHPPTLWKLVEADVVGKHVNAVLI